MTAPVLLVAMGNTIEGRPGGAVGAHPGLRFHLPVGGLDRWGGVGVAVEEGLGLWVGRGPTPNTVSTLWA